MSTRPLIAAVVALRFGWVAQLAEQRTENPRVGGSIPPPATPLFQRENARGTPVFRLPDEKAGNERNTGFAEGKGLCIVMQPALPTALPARLSLGPGQRTAA